MINDRFINGITNDMLRTAILASYKTENSFTRVLGSKTMLQRAVELDEIYVRKQVEIYVRKLFENNVQLMLIRFAIIVTNEDIIRQIVRNHNVHYVHHLQIQVKAHMVTISVERVNIIYHQKPQHRQIQLRRH